MKTQVAVSLVLAACWLGAGCVLADSSFDAMPQARVTLDLSDGSRLVGELTVEKLPFQSTLLGSMQLPVAQIRSVTWEPKSGKATLKAASGDSMEVKLDAAELRVKTGFGEVKVPSAMLRQMGVATFGGPSDLQRGLVALWSAEGNAKDSAGTHHGEMIYGAEFADGKVGQAFSFDSDRARVYIPDAPEFAIEGSYSVAGWLFVREISTPGNADCVFSRGDNRPGADPWNIATLPDGQVLFATCTENDLSVRISGPMKQGQWFHFAFVYDAERERFRLYVDGKLAAEKTAEFKPMFRLDRGQDASVCLGNVCGRFHTFPFRGMMDEWAIYNRALSPAEVETLVGLGNSGERLRPPPSGKDVPPKRERLKISAANSEA
jgi:hypothetical protein